MKRIKLSQRASIRIVQTGENIWRKMNAYGAAVALMTWFLTASLFTGPIAVAAEVNTTRSVLEALYSATDGDNWTNNTGWLGEPGTECSWHGIVCENDEVISIEMDRNGLVGTLPAELGSLTTLRSLFFGGNELSGTLPPEIGNLSSLGGFWAWGNQLTGTIPQQWANLTTLRYLGLGSNQLSGSLPSFLGNFTNLIDLSLNRNAFTGTVPVELASLTSATAIDLSNNQLSGDVPQSVLDLGVVNLWANPELTNIAFGDPAACENQTPLTLDTPVNGELTPFLDCYFIDDTGPLMADFYRLDLSAAVGTTLIQVDAYSDHYHPHVGVLDSDGFDGLDIVDTQVQQKGLSFEVALPPGEYVLYIHGGTYQPQNEAATGAYTLDTTVISQAQVDCPAPTWVTKGVSLDAALSADDCLDTYGDPHRLYDSYNIWLEQGESITVALTADFPSQLFHFIGHQFNTLSSSAQPQILTFTANNSGWHRYAVYPPTTNPQVEGNYSIQFLEPPTFGNPQACGVNIPTLALGGSTEGATLDQTSDCYSTSGRMLDFYDFSVPTDTLLRITLNTSGFDPLLSLFRRGDQLTQLTSRAVANRSDMVLETYLQAGDYRVFASSWQSNALDPVEGGYQLALSESLPVGEIQSGPLGSAFVFAGASVTGELTTDDGRDTLVAEVEARPYLDGYSFRLEAGQLLYPRLQADFNARLSHWFNGQHQQVYNADAGDVLRMALNRAGSHTLYVIGQGVDDLGSYDLDLLTSQPQLDTVPVAFSYTFTGYSNFVDGVLETGPSDHVLEGVLDVVMADDDIFEVIGIREASLDGNPYTVGAEPGIVAYRADQPPLMSLSGNVLDMLICPNGFTSGNDCPFGAEGGFLLSDVWPLTGSSAGQSGALAGHPNLGASYRDRSIPIVRANWSASLITETAPQHDILVAFYNATGGDNWTNNTGWLGEPGTECDWHGVNCNGEGQIIGLELVNNNLIGTLPVILKDLVHLNYLILGQNQLSGSIPVEYGQLVNLGNLALWANQLSGTIPASLANLTNLHWLSLGGNQLTGNIPAELGNLNELRGMFLNLNELNGSIPDSLGNLSNLERLDLNSNLLTGQVPASLANLINATSVDLRNNLLSGDVPQSVLDLGVVSLWANINLNLPKGDAAACVASSPIAVGGSVSGELTPFTDCYVADENAMVDFYQLDLSAASGTTLLRVEADSQSYWPRLGILGAEVAEDLGVVETQFGEPPFAIEVALAPGQYTLYVHGGVYNHDKNVNVPATGEYSLSVTSINELQAGCLDFNNTWVTKGTEVTAALSSDDCIDDFNEPSRLFDSYAIWLEQGEAVTVTLEADIATQLLSFNQNGFISGTPFTAANTKHGLTVTASNSGWHRFAPYTTNNNPTETGTYTIRFVEPIVVGDTEACTQGLPVVGLGDSVQGALNADIDCFNLNRLSDRYVLDISESTLFRADITTDGFMPLLGLYRAGNTDILLGNRVGINESTTLEFYLTPGQYWLFASSRFPVLDEAIEGSYTLSLSESLPINQMQTGGCEAGDTRLVLGGPLSINGQVNEQDCFDATEIGDQDGNPERDSYQFVMPAGSVPVEVNLGADFNARLSIWRSGTTPLAQAISAGGNTAMTLTEPGSYQINVLGQQGPNAGTPDRGNYTLAISPQVGNVGACSSLPTINLGDSISGTLDRNADCVRDGRLTDRYLLNLTDTTLFRVEQTDNQFAPFTGIYLASDDNRLLGSRVAQQNVFTEYLLPAGQYLVFASTWSTDPLLPPAGDYTLSISEALPLGDVQTDPQYGPTRLMQIDAINGELASTDARDQFGATFEQARYLDGYSFAVPNGETLTVTAQAGFPILLSKWQGTSFSNLQFTEALPAAANTQVSFELSGPANYLIYVVGNQDGVTGEYTLGFSGFVVNEPDPEPSAQRQILESLYNATDGDNWTNNTGWLGEPGTECNWFGVNCDGEGRVVGLNLQGNNLSGQIPTALGDLIDLQTLDLSRNLLTGTIPAELGNLFNLQQLLLNNNLLNGTVPAAVENLPQLTLLNIWANMGMDIALGSSAACISTTALGLDDSVSGELLPFEDCYIEELIAVNDFFDLELQEMTLVRLLAQSDAYYPRVGVLTTDGGMLTGERFHDNSVAMEVLLPAGQYMPFVNGGTYNHEYNVGVPATGPYNLRTQTLTEPQVGCQGSTFVMLGSVANGQLTSDDCIDEFRNPPRIHDNYEIWLDAGEAISVVLTADFPFLQLRWAGNEFGGGSPSMAAGATHRFTVYANESGMHRFAIYTGNETPEQGGSYTMSIVEPTEPPEQQQQALVALYNATDGANWTDNSNWLVEGAPVCSWARIRCDVAGNVVAIDLHNNNLSGYIPTEIGVFDRLEYLALATNALTGTMPAEIGDLAALQVLYLANNELSGPIPATLGQLNNLRILSLVNNALTGSIPAELGSLDNLTGLYLSANSLSGPLPDTLANLTELQNMQLPNNQLSGPIPDWLGDLTQLKDLVLYGNNLSGSIPATLGQLTQLTTLSLHFNGLTGPIPSELSQMTQLKYLFLSNNELDGSIPVGLTQLNNLTLLRLANNNLTGTVPVFSISVDVDVSGNPLATPPAQQIYLNAPGIVFKNGFNNLPFFYDVTDDDATLTGVGIHIHYDSSQINEIEFANVFNMSVLAADASGSADINDLDNDPQTDRYITIGWSDVNGEWPGSLPGKLFDLRLQLNEEMGTEDQLLLNLSRTSNTSGYELELPRLSLEVVTATLDVDGNGDIKPLTDGLLIIRSLFGFSGAALVSQVVADDAVFTTDTEIQDRLQQISPIIDVDGNGDDDALTDGLLIMRYLFGFRGDVLIANAIGSGATRTTAAQIEAYLSVIVP